MRKILSVLALSLVIFGCNKSNTTKQCESSKTGTLKISNNSNDVYDIYVDDVYKLSISGGTIKEITLNEGNNRNLYAEQIDGYLVYPTKISETLNIVRCSSYNWQIP